MNKKELNNLILITYNGLENNSFSTLGKPDKPMWEAPLIGVAAGDDKYFDFLKEHIGAFHWSPIDAFHLKYGAVPGAVPRVAPGVAHANVPANPPGVAATLPANLRVVSIAFPQTMETK